MICLFSKEKPRVRVFFPRKNTELREVFFHGEKHENEWFSSALNNVTRHSISSKAIIHLQSQVFVGMIKISFDRIRLFRHSFSFIQIFEFKDPSVWKSPQPSNIADFCLLNVMAKPLLKELRDCC